MFYTIIKTRNFKKTLLIGLDLAPYFAIFRNRRYEKYLAGLAVQKIDPVSQPATKGIQ